MSSTKAMNHPELKIKGATIVGMDKLPELVKADGADNPAPEAKPKKSKSKE